MVEKRTSWALTEEVVHVEVVTTLPARVEKKRVEVYKEEVSKEDVVMEFPLIVETVI
jgi:hypothetical protein